MKSLLSSVVIVVVAMVVGCGDAGAPKGAGMKPVVAPSPALAKLALTDRPSGAIAVKAAKQAGPSDACTVSGRVSNVVPGFAVFTLMDAALPYCGEKSPEDSCKTPWDYCCETREARAANSLLVEVRDANDKPIAGELGDLRLLDAVTVTGKLIEDPHGNDVLLANGWFRDARPNLPADLRWPQ